MLWQIPEPDKKAGHLYIGELGIVENDLGLKSDSVWPGARSALVHMVNLSRRPSVVWFTWRPAIYLYGLLFCVGLAAFRAKNATMLLIGVPGALNSLVWLGMITTQDFRFQYPVYVMALLAPALLFVAQRETRA
jgi:hypothetical protein